MKKYRVSACIAGRYFRRIFQERNIAAASVL